MAIYQGESSRITLPSSMKSRDGGCIPSTLLTPAIAHPSIAPLLNTIYIIIYIPILIIVALATLLAVTLASATASTTAPTSCVLLLGLLDLDLVTRMQEIWSVVFAATIITWAFSLELPCRWLDGVLHWLETFK